MTSELGEFMYEAVNRSDVENIKALLQKGVRVNTLVQSGFTLLGQAVKIGNIEVLRLLLSAEELSPPDDAQYAVTSEQKYALEETLDAFLRPNDTQQGTSCQPPRASDSCIFLPRDDVSHNQMGLGLFQSLRRLAPHCRKTDVNLPDFYDRMPVHYAADLGRTDILDLLLKAGCRVNVSDSDNVTPLHLAVTRGHEEVAVMLLKAGSRVNSKNSDKSSTLHIAASRGYTGIVKKLLQHGAMVDVPDASERTPLLVAVSRGHAEVVKVLLDYHANANIEEIHGYTPLSEAVWRRDVALVRLLLDAGAKVPHGQHLLHYAVAHGVTSLASLLLERGASVNVRDALGNTPMHLAIRNKHPEMLQEFFRSGGDVNITNGLSGLSLLHEVVLELQEENLSMFRTILNVLLSYGCEMNCESFTKGDTPLFRALLTNKVLFAEELIREGSDVNSGNVYSCDIDNMWLAKRSKNLSLVQMIFYAGYDMQRTPLSCTVPERLAGSLQSDNIERWLAFVKRNPMSLCSFCRIVLRRHLKQNLSAKISFLDVPVRVRDFLLLKDICGPGLALEEDGELVNAS
ncbi:serine/threonine-protein phosphatase 6 regulatory ankyrin repeat subunit B-like [Ornithodoros turicata]|uniref:serine/threonine-protein phosphatase 6 regulatory ankyrin repeat subunit B-like n=1 Tax=Ornithodoros turicata TaxID=34597 RepID=UPI003139371A